MNYLLLNATDYYLHSDKLLEDKESNAILMQAIDQLSPQRNRSSLAANLKETATRKLDENWGSQWRL